MDEQSAKNVLGVTGEVTHDEITNIYNRKRASLLSKEFSGEDVKTEILQIEEALAVLNGSKKDPEEHLPKQLATVPTPQPQPENLINIPWLNNNPSKSPYKACPNCGGMIPAEVIICDICQTQIGRSCPSCGNTISLDTRICQRCGTAIQEFDRKRFSNALSIEQKTNEERVKTADQAEVTERDNKDYVVKGTFLWLIIFVILIIFCIIAYALYNQYFQV